MTMAMILGAAGIVLLIAVVALRKVPSFQSGVPAWAGGTLSGLLLGLGIGFVAMHQFGYRWERQLRPPGPAPDPAKSGQAASSSGPTQGGSPGGGAPGGGGPGGAIGGGAPGGGPPGGGGPGGGGGPAGGGGPGGGQGGGGGRGGRTTPQAALSAMVRKLNILSIATSAQIGADQAKKIAQTLDELSQVQGLMDEDAEKMVNSIRDALTEDQIKLLDSMGLAPGRGPGGGGAPGPGDPYQNPFMQDGDAKTSLAQLRDRLQQQSQ